jgi:DNA-binding response OmpR family regulator
MKASPVGNVPGWSALVNGSARVVSMDDARRVRQPLTFHPIAYSHPDTMSPTTTKPLTVLLAEDEPAMLSLVARHMKTLGFDRVLEASDGRTAWSLAEKHHPDLIVLDVMMPEMSGWEVAKEVKGAAGGALANTPVLMLTGIGERMNEMTSPLFADGWLDKPFEFSKLDEKIRELLAKYGKEMPNAAKGAQDEPDAEPVETAPPVTKSRLASKSGSKARKAAPAAKKASAKTAAKATKKAPAKGAAKATKAGAKTAAKATKAGAKTAAKATKAGAKTAAKATKAGAKSTAKKGAAAKKVAPKKGAAAKRVAAKKPAPATRRSK